MTFADPLAAVQAEAAAATTTLTASVTSVATDGTVTITLAGAPVPGVPCLDSYASRKAGDAVRVAVTAGQMLVLGRIGNPADQQAAAVTEFHASASAPPAGAGWEAVTTGVWAKAGAIWLQYAAAPPPGPADPATVNSTNWGAWRGSQRATWADGPTQGDWTGGGNYKGAWFWGSAITSALSGMTVASATVTITRSSTLHGSYGSVGVNLYLHNAGSPGSSAPATVAGPIDAGGLGLGQSRAITLPTAWADQLKAGTAKGFGITGSGRSDYLIATTSAVFKATFS